jgi:flagellar L-ring protein precursor FlgH
MTSHFSHLAHDGPVRFPWAMRLAVTTCALTIPLSLFAQAPVAAPATATAPTGAPPVTTPAASTAGATVAAAGGVALPAPRASWFADKRTFVVGDIITVLIDDYTITTAVKENSASDTRSRNLGLTARLPSGTSKSAGLDTRNDATQNQRGSAKRENRFQNEMSVRVVAVAPNGLLQVKGTKNIDIDKNVQDIVLTGWVRVQDVSPANSVESARIADAQIGYASPGTLSKPKQGIVSKILGALWP